MTSGLSQPTYPGSASRGFAWKQVLVTGINGNTAVVQDSVTKKTFNVSIKNMPAKGLAPAAGETWLVTRQFHVWSFALCLNAPTSIGISDIAGLTTALGRPALETTLYGTSAVHYHAHAITIPEVTWNATGGAAPVQGTLINMTDANGGFVGLTFPAPPSGIMRIGWGGNCRPNAAGTVNVGVIVRQGDVLGSGGMQSNFSQLEAMTFSGTGILMPGSRVKYVTGLTNGNIYNVYIVWSYNSPGSADCNNPWVEVMPAAQ